MTGTTDSIEGAWSLRTLLLNGNELECNAARLDNASQLAQVHPAQLLHVAFSTSLCLRVSFPVSVSHSLCVCDSSLCLCLCPSASLSHPWVPVSHCLFLGFSSFFLHVSSLCLSVWLSGQGFFTDPHVSMSVSRSLCLSVWFVFCCYNEGKGTQDLKICSHAHSLHDSLSARLSGPSVSASSLCLHASPLYLSAWLTLSVWLYGQGFFTDPVSEVFAGLGKDIATSEPFVDPFSLIKSISYVSTVLALAGNPFLTVGTSLLSGGEPGRLVKQDRIRHGKLALFSGATTPLVLCSHGAELLV